MRTTFKIITVFLLTAFIFQSCQDDDDVIAPSNTDSQNVGIQNFIWKGLNLYYLWQTNVPNLSDNK